MIQLLGMTEARKRIFQAGQIAEARRQTKAEQQALVQHRADEAKAEKHRAQAAAAYARFAEEAAKVASPSRLIVDEICAKYGVTFEDLKSESRVGRLNPPRQECFYRLLAETPMSLLAIGKRFHRDHTTVLSGTRKHARVNGLPEAKDIKWANGLASSMDTTRPRKSVEVQK